MAEDRVGGKWFVEFPYHILLDDVCYMANGRDMDISDDEYAARLDEQAVV